MAPTPLKRLVALQRSRLTELQGTSTRLHERNRGSLNRNIIQARLDKLETLWSDARDTDAEIMTREIAETEPYVAEDMFNAIHKLYEETTDFLLTVKGEIEAVTRPAARSVESTSDRGFDDDGPSAAKLPKVDLPKFSGRYEDWENFYDLFTSLVHNSTRISDATKLQYLKTCLEGEAAALVRDVSTTNANYVSTWQALRLRFHCPRIITNNLLRELVEMPQLKRESAADLQKFTDSVGRIVRALKNLKMPVEHWDVWFGFLIPARLDTESRKLWEAEQSVRDRRAILNADSNSADANPLDRFPKFDDLVEFLLQRTHSLGVIAADRSTTEDRRSAPSKTTPGPSRRIHHATSSNSESERKGCPVCTGRHPLYKCYKFKSKNPEERRREVQRLKICFNCFRKHLVKDCPSTYACATCGNKHHSMLHVNAPAGGNQVAHSTQKQEASGVNVHTSTIASEEYSVILATAQLIIEGPNGTRTQIRALLDLGSETSFISDSIANLIGLPKHRVNIPLTGVGSTTTGTAHAATRFNIVSLVDPSFRLKTDALALPKLTSKLPSRQAMNLRLDLLAGLSLADPQFYVPDSVDAIFGAEVYGQLLRSGLRNFPALSLTAQNTALGWIVFGRVKSGGARRAAPAPRSNIPFQSLHCATDSEINATLQKFWDLEELPPVIKPLSPQEDACENLFTETHTRDSTGRFVVHLPFKSEPPPASQETYRMALSSLTHMHRRFARDSKLASAYQEFMDTYEKLGHMERVPDSEINNPRAWYLPHHAVVQSTPSSWKIRVVFDASRKTREKQCLNDFLEPGTSLQRELCLVLLYWRLFQFVFSADEVKMFRQIRVVRKHQDFQRILWAPTPQHKPVVYRLTTVTYGTSSAPYLALRSLKELANNERHRFPLGAQCLDSNTYVDDTYAGDDDLSVAVQMQQQLIGILATAGFELDKWAANHPDLLPNRDSKNESNESKPIAASETVKTLGVQWDPKQDEFRFTTVNFNDLAGALTKRSVLSSIFRLFDPLGWLSPITVTAKILMQDLWLLKSEWDAPLPSEVRDRWLAYCDSLSTLPALSRKRWLGAPLQDNVQIHGFSDASSRAYAAAVYIRINDGHGGYRVSLLAAKSKVAPVKTVSIPNLELCGAVLLVKLLLHVRKLEPLKDLPVFAWSDSQIVLTWLQKHPCTWKVFVANRVSFIQTELPIATWAHVPTKENPADLATRGCNPFDLIHADLWWHGPHWLTAQEEHWPKQAAPAARVLHVKASPSEPELLERFSSLQRLTRVVAYCLRPLTNLRRRKSGLSNLPDFITVPELTAARVAVIRLAQSHAFSNEIKTLREGKDLSKCHPLLSLNPIFDAKDGILRVGGRLGNADLPRDRRHPPILPRQSALSRLFARYAHRLCLHGGPNLTSATITQYVWILGRNRLVKTEIHNCVTCQRVKPRTAQQLMGELPATRVNPARPFSSTGLDYAGPFQIRTTKGRGHKAYKGYIALFVCFATRAIHLEAVSDLSAQTFLAAYRRFAGHRGVCKNLYSDNATNFRAADKELKSMFMNSSDFYKSTAATLSNDGTNWTFIPPNSPHYGGLWEAGVRSVKHHLKRAFSEKMLTFEEFSTVLVEIEACLNSRPLSPLNSDVDDLRALTPAHFLIGGASGLVPDSAPPNVPEGRLERFHLLQSVLHKFWNQWSKEYLHHLQERSKWRTPTDNFAVGQLVLVRDDRYPPSKWPLGRVTEVHLGTDGLVRVVTVRTSNSYLRRHIARLCPLSLEQNPPGTDKTNTASS